MYLAKLKPSDLNGTSHVLETSLVEKMTSLININRTFAPSPSKASFCRDTSYESSLQAHLLNKHGSLRSNEDFNGFFARIPR